MWRCNHTTCRDWKRDGDVIWYTPQGKFDVMDMIEDFKSNQACIGLESRVFGAVGGWVGALCRENCEDCCEREIGYN